MELEGFEEEHRGAGKATDHLQEDAPSSSKTYLDTNGCMNFPDFL